MILGSASFNLIFLVAAPVIVIAFSVAIRFIAAPLLLRRERISTRPKCQPTRSENLSPQAREFFGRAIARFAQRKFDLAANVHFPSFVQNGESFVLLFVNRESGDTATAAAMHQPHKWHYAMTVVSELAEGRMLATTNAATPDVIGAEPADALCLPWVDDAAILCEAHLRWLASLGLATQQRVVLPAGREIAHLATSQTRDLERLIQRRWCWKNEAAGYARFTWKGATLAAWSNLEPFAGRRRKRIKRESTRLWKQLNMHSFAAPDAPAVNESATARIAPVAAIDPILPGAALLPPDGNADGQITGGAAADVLCADIVWLAGVLRVAGGSATISVSPGHLRYARAACLPREDEIARELLQRISVGIVRRGLLGRQYCLLVTDSQSQRSRKLLASEDGLSLQSLRHQMCEILGLTG